MKKNEPILTVVTTTYNHSEYIASCIESVVNQKTNFNFEFLIADDKSSDDTPKIISKYQQKYPFIKVIYRKKNIGAMKNFINTLNEVHTKYVALLDGDDYWCDNTKLQTQVDFLEKHPEYTVCFHKTKIFFQDNSRKSTIHPLGYNSELSFSDIAHENIIPANSVMYRWKYITKNSLKKEFPKNIVPGDYFLHLVHAYGHKIHFIKKVMSHYRRHDRGMWWLVSQPDKIDTFYDKYGIPYLNFYINVGKILDLNEDFFKLEKDWIIKKSFISFIKLRRSKKIRQLYKNCPNNKSDFEEMINEFSLKDKIFYYFNTQPLVFFKKSIKIGINKMKKRLK